MKSLITTAQIYGTNRISRIGNWRLSFSYLRHGRTNRRYSCGHQRDTTWGTEGSFHLSLPFINNNQEFLQIHVMGNCCCPMQWFG